jgi:hypothetical protein
VEGSEGNRRRTPSTLTSLSLDDNVLITLAGTAIRQAWTKEEIPKSEGGEGPGQPDLLPPPPPESGSSGSTWDQAVEMSEKKALLELRLIARSPAAASTLASLAQPLGAESLSLAVTVGGNLRDGGKMNFAATDVKLTHPTKPLSTAQTIFNSLAEGSSYEAQLRLDFGATGRSGMTDLLKQLQSSAPDGVSVYARFDRPAGAMA